MASSGDAFVNHARLNNLIRFEKLISKPINEPSSKLICKVNGINTSYTFEAVNGVNAKQFEAVNGINTSYTFEAVNGVNVDASQPTVAKTFEGAQNPSSMLIVGCNMAFGPAFGHNSASGPAFGQNLASGLAFGHNMAFGPAFGHNMAFSPAFGHSKLIKLIGRVGHINSLVDSIGRFDFQTTNNF